MSAFLYCNSSDKFAKLDTLDTRSWNDFHTLTYSSQTRSYSRLWYQH